MGTINRYNEKIDAITTPCVFDVNINKNIKKCQCDIDENSCLENLYYSIMEHIKKNEVVIDVIHCHGWMMWGVAKRISKELSTPIVATIHFVEKIYDLLGIKMNCSEDIVKRVRLTEAEMVTNANAIICISEYCSRLLKSCYPSLQHVNIVYHGIEERQLLNKNKKDNFLFVGRLSPEKGIDQLYQIFADNPDYHLDVVGSGVLLPREDISNISYLGSFSQSELFEKMSTYKFVVLPYLSDLFGLVLIESISCGCIPIVSNQGSFPELMKHFSGFTFEIKNNIVNKNNVIKTLCEVRNLPLEQLDEIRLFNYSKYKELFTDEQMINGILNVYRKVVKE